MSHPSPLYIIYATMKRYLIILMSLAVCGQCAAQGGVAGFFKKVGAFIDTMSVKGLDRNYIDAPEKPWQIIVKGNVNQSVLKMETSGEPSMLAATKVATSLSEQRAEPME